VSRFDRKLDEKLKSLDIEEGKVGIYNAINAYKIIEDYGLKNIRALFASTGVKGDKFPADYYIRELLLKNSVNTAPLSTINCFIASKKIDEEVLIDTKTELFFEKLEKNGIDLDLVCDELMAEGLEAFKEAFKEILDALK
jgi:transaldolase